MAKDLIEDVWKSDEDRSVIQILRNKPVGEKGGNDFFRVAEALYLLSERDYEDCYPSKLSETAATSGKQLGKYYKYLSREGLVSPGEHEEGKKKRYFLTDKGRYVLDIIRPLFESLNETYLLEKELENFKDRYFRNPTLEEISLQVGDTIEKEELLETGKWASPDLPDYKARRKAVEHIAAGIIILHTKARGISAIKSYTNSDYPTADFSYIIECSEDQEQEEYLRYASNNSRFLKSLNVEIEQNISAIINFDDFNSKILDCDVVTLNLRNDERNDELWISLSD